MKAMLIDTTRCIGCRACQVACKQWNGGEAEVNKFFAGDGYQNPRDLTTETLTLITFNEVEHDGRLHWIFRKKACYHCLEPACATACLVGALKKTEEGPVTYNASLCLGCRYCQIACPFTVPRFEWHKAIPEIKKCTMCSDRIAEGMEPACASACPTDAILFGERDALIAEGESRIAARPGGYYPAVYGKEEVGGTCVMYLAALPFDKLGLDTTVPRHALGERVAPAMKPIPFVIGGLGIGLGAVSWVIHRRMEVGAQANTENTKGATLES